MSQREADIKNCYNRIETIERGLRLRELTSDERTKFDHELSSLKELLKINEEQLKALQKENFKTGLLVSAVVFVCFVFYCLHAMFWK